MKPNTSRARECEDKFNLEWQINGLNVGFRYTQPSQNLLESERLLAQNLVNSIARQLPTLDNRYNPLPQPCKTYWDRADLTRHQSETAPPNRDWQ